MKRRVLLQWLLATPLLASCKEIARRDQPLLSMPPGEAPYGVSFGERLSRLPETGEVLNLYVIGDSGRGNADQRNAAQAMADYHARYPIDLVVHTGDIIYSSGLSSADDPQADAKFQSIYAEAGLADIPWFAVLGNHDHKDNPQAMLDYASRDTNCLNIPGFCYSLNTRTGAIYQPRFGQTGAATALSGPEVELIALDTTPIAKGKGHLAQLQFLEKRLATSTARHTLVFGHHPVYSYGRYGGEPPVADALRALLEYYGADLYLCGHEHDLQLIAARAGVAYLVSGGGGAGLRHTGVGDDTRFAAARHGGFGLRISEGQVIAVPVIAPWRDRSGEPQGSPVADDYLGYLI